MALGNVERGCGPRSGNVVLGTREWGTFSFRSVKIHSKCRFSFPVTRSSIRRSGGDYAHGFLQKVNLRLNVGNLGCSLLDSFRLPEHDTCLLALYLCCAQYSPLLQQVDNKVKKFVDPYPSHVLNSAQVCLATYIQTSEQDEMSAFIINLYCFILNSRNAISTFFTAKYSSII